MFQCILNLLQLKNIYFSCEQVGSPSSLRTCPQLGFFYAFLYFFIILAKSRNCVCHELYKSTHLGGKVNMKKAEKMLIGETFLSSSVRINHHRRTSRTSSR